MTNLSFRAARTARTAPRNGATATARNSCAAYGGNPTYHNSDNAQGKSIVERQSALVSALHKTRACFDQVLEQGLKTAEKPGGGWRERTTTNVSVSEYPYIDDLSIVSRVLRGESPARPMANTSAAANKNPHQVAILLGVHGFWPGCKPLEQHFWLLMGTGPTCAPGKAAADITFAGGAA